MPDIRYQEAARRIEVLLKPLIGVRPLNTGEISFYENHFLQGWEIPGLCEDSEFKFRLLLPSTAPYSPPRVAVWPAPLLLEWPHLEEKGLLCLMSDTATYSIYDDYAGVAMYLLKDAIELVRDSMSGANISHFEDEFQSYWKRWEGAKDNYIHTHCLPEGPSRWTSSWHSKGGCWVADNETDLLKWMENRCGKEACSKVRPQKIPLLWLPRALRPKEYPKSVHMLRSTLKELGVDDSMLKRLLLDEQLKHKSVVVGFKGRQGAGFAGLFMGRPTAPLKVGGFRKRPPGDIMLMRYSRAKITGAQAIRLDSPWIHGRDHNSQERALSKKSVVVFGIGSIGSFVVGLLAMSGVGELILVDPEALSSENPGRHVLGIDSIRMNKAKKLAKDLNARFPHLKISGYDKKCEDFSKTILPAIRRPDLIISTIGSWRSEGLLNAMAVDSVISSPILYGWTEPHATAGHAVVFHDGKGCLRCIRDDMGKVKLPVTLWSEEGTLVPVPACGGYFQPYGAVEITHIHGLIADLALDVLLGNTITSAHRVWIGSKKIIESTGVGTWNPLWIDRYGELGRGGCLKDVEILPAPDCPECGRRP
ncbi:MAG: ThiF family adenylyltransferase [Deltaproteobacteria bacterium]|nr:ThiF family adenylyltransferase [Deltaproteobacteria bacterium]